MANKVVVSIKKNLPCIKLLVNVRKYHGRYVSISNKGGRNGALKGHGDIGMTYL